MVGRRTPLVLQMEAAECGAACLAMVLARYGRWITLEEARESCGTSRDGVDAAGLCAAARSYGLTVVPLRREPETLADLPLPQIIHWCFNHFVVLEAIGRDHFVILDPAQGQRRVSALEFGESFTGLTLALEPGPEFEREGSPPAVAGTLMQEALRSPDAMAIALGTGVLTVVPGLALAGAMSTFVDQILGAGQKGWTAAFLGVLLAVVIAQVVLAYLSAWVVATWKIKIGATSALRGFWRALTMPLSFFSQRSAGEVVARIRLGSDVGGAVAGPLAEVAPQLLVAAAYFLILSLYDPIIMAAAFGTCVVNFAILRGISNRLAERTREHQLAEGRAAAVATSGMVNFQAYQMLGRERLLLGNWIAGEESAIATEQGLGMMRAIANLGPVTSSLLLSGVVLIVGAARAMEGTLSLGDLVAIQMLAGLLNKPIAALAASLCQIQESAGSLMRLADLEHHRVAAAFDDRVRVEAPARTEGRLVLAGVSFAHSPGRPVLREITCVIEPGSLVALIGGSGAGKSTMARVLAGLIEPSEGMAILDGIALSDWPQEELRRRMVYIGQAPATFSGTIEQNITLWDQSISSEAVMAAMQRVGLAEAVARRPAGPSTKIAAGDTGFSGGELQRLALARALVRRPAVLILDETTSALDARSEEQVLDMLRKTGATVVIVTHRPGTALRCDRAILLKEGTIAAQGVPAQLMADMSASFDTASRAA
ncbi:cysteine peptidase family C39 domain-containing protein [Tabrizicola sp.]|uniref:cysteine peptidase family C39 domain-containing protein n=1 Tax=Tabrizicola sp. TaxID=2005166 RepID=UPI003D28FE12